MEISPTISKYRILSMILFAPINIILLLIRKLNKLFSVKDGNVVIISLHKLGDTVLTIPAVVELQKIYNKKIIMVCFPEAMPIYQLKLSDISYYIVEHKNFFFNERIAGKIARKTLKSTSPEIIVDLNGVMTSVSLIFNSKAKITIGMGREQFRNLYDYYTPIRRSPDMIDRYLDIVALIKPEINSNRENLKQTSVTINSNNRFLFHLSAGWEAKEWNFKSFVKMVLKFKKKFNVCVVLREEDISLDELKELIENEIDYTISNSVSELINTIRNCDYFIGNDSGPLHIASLLGKITLTIYRPTNPKFTMPHGILHEYVNEKLNCSPLNNVDYCFTLAGQLGCPSYECMNQLKYEVVSNRLFNLSNN